MGAWLLDCFGLDVAPSAHAPPAIGAAWQRGAGHAGTSGWRETAGRPRAREREGAGW